MINYKTADRLFHDDIVRIDDEVGQVSRVEFLNGEMMNIVIDFLDGTASNFLVPDKFEFEFLGEGD